MTPHYVMYTHLTPCPHMTHGHMSKWLTPTDLIYNGHMTRLLSENPNMFLWTQVLHWGGGRWWMAACVGWMHKLKEDTLRNKRSNGTARFFQRNGKSRHDNFQHADSKHNHKLPSRRGNRTVGKSCPYQSMCPVIYADRDISMISTRLHFHSWEIGALVYPVGGGGSKPWGVRTWRVYPIRQVETKLFTMKRSVRIIFAFQVTRQIPW